MQFSTTILALAATAFAAPNLSTRDYQCQFGQYACSDDGLTIKQCDISGNWVVRASIGKRKSLYNCIALLTDLSRRLALVARTRSAHTLTPTTCLTASAPPARGRRRRRRSAESRLALTPALTPALETEPASTSAMPRTSSCSMGCAPRERTARLSLQLKAFRSASTTKRWFCGLTCSSFQGRGCHNGYAVDVQSMDAQGIAPQMRLSGTIL